MHRTKKHHSKKDRFFESLTSVSSVTLVNTPPSELENEPVIPVKNVPLLVNELIKNKEIHVEQAVKFLQSINNQIRNNKQVTICANCAKKIGIKKCSQCPSTSTIRYCSRGCQVANWPAHKSCCGARNIIDVE
jgi:hypothetical protein